MPRCKATQEPAPRLVRASSRIRKPSQKRSEPTYEAITPSAKRPRTRKTPQNSARPLLSRQRISEPIEISDLDPDCEELGDDEDEESVVEIQNDDAEEVEEEETRPMKFRSTWRAICGKEIS
jgi:hypothetical protein